MSAQPMQFVRAEYEPDAYDPVAIQRDFKVTEEQAKELAVRASEDRVYLSDAYQVVIRDLDEEGVMQHLSIKRLDREPIHDWRELQAIKNALVGEECEAVELYPAESRLVDSANQYHLWACSSPTVRFPIGFSQRLVMENPPAKAKQRPFNQTRKEQTEQ